MAALFNPPSLPNVQPVPPPPSMETPAVNQAAQDELKRLATQKGRASTYLTNPKDQQTASPSAQRYLGAA